MKGKKTMKIITSNTHSAFALLAIACLAVSPCAVAVFPPPDGGYPNNTTAEGQNALFSLMTGTDNTAVGANAMYGNTGVRCRIWAA
jgi:hypothetical protein